MENATVRGAESTGNLSDRWAVGSWGQALGARCLRRVQVGMYRWGGYEPEEFSAMQHESHTRGV